MADMAERQKLAIDELTARNHKLQELVEDPELTDRMRDLERQNASLLVKQKQLMEEVDDMRCGTQCCLTMQQFNFAWTVARRTPRVWSATSSGWRRSAN